MEKVRTSVVINVPVEEAFSYWADPRNRPEVWPSLVEISDVQPLPNGGETHRWVYKMAGVRLEGKSETVEYVPNERIVEKEEGGVQALFTWAFEAVAGGTRMDTEAEYTVPIAVLGKLAERFIVRLNQNEADVISANIRARLED